MLPPCSTGLMKPGQFRLEVSAMKCLTAAQTCRRNVHATNLNSTFSPEIKTKLEALNKIFPKNVEEISELVITRPEVLDYKTDTVKSLARILRYHGKDKLLENSDIIQLLENYPEVLKIPALEFEKRMVDMLIRCGVHEVPWKSVIIENPDIVATDHNIVLQTLDNLRQYFNKKEIYTLIYNNPSIFRDQWEDIDKKLKYLMHTMNVSLQRIAKTPGSLMESLQFYDLRYQFLKRSGNYIHPTGNQLGSKPVEAEPSLFLICTSDDRLFIKTCTPNLTLEELNTFKSLHYLETEATSHVDDDEHGNDDGDNEEKQVGYSGASYGKINRNNVKKKKDFKFKKKNSNPI
jgi:hypothetical protein